ncbi:hypothetical protein [Neomoorella mulderi]|uniref:Uncharacterized protein n=1 Tax=Moorella mulderi DSM 14980 TaxID=1122241 RepID=A0A151ATV5_9FIRM|nr:hypothetical protein [Moorella mulderi]KYH30980.1 hypothetical protein MOMUL_27640 [Moorella mulderi DSM 14980]
MGFIKNLLKPLRDQRGSSFIENALWIIVVVLLVAGAGYALASQGVTPKLDQIRQSISDVQVPDIN